MPYYDFHCRDCDSVFTERRTMAQASEPAVCACGSADTHKLLSVVAFSMAGGGSSAAHSESIPLPMNAGGGCCGGGACGCGL